MKKKVISKEECDDICALLKNLKMRHNETPVDTETQAYGLQASYLNEGDFTTDEMERMVENWVTVEDDPDIVDAMVEDEIGDLEKAENDESVEYESKCEPEVATNVEERRSLTFLEASDRVEDLRSYCRENNIDKQTLNHLDIFLRGI